MIGYIFSIAVFFYLEPFGQFSSGFTQATFCVVIKVAKEVIDCRGNSLAS